MAPHARNTQDRGLMLSEVPMLLREGTLPGNRPDLSPMLIKQELSKLREDAVLGHDCRLDTIANFF